MKRRIVLAAALCAIVAGAAAVAAERGVILPSGWLLATPQTAAAATGTMPQGIALSPDEKRLAVVESGAGPAGLRILDVPSLKFERLIKLKGAFGRPAWLDNDHLLVAGANLDAVLEVDANDGTIYQTDSTGKGSWPAAVIAGSPFSEILFASANDGNATVSVKGFVTGVTATYAVGPHPSDLVLTHGGGVLYVACRGDSTVRAIYLNLQHDMTKSIAVGKHPSALALSPDEKTLYVANGDDDTISKIDTATLRSSGTIGLHPDLSPAKCIDNGCKPTSLAFGALPNSLLARGNKLYVTLGGANTLATIAKGRIVATAPTGWYPTGVAVASDGTVFVSDGKGEGSPANPLYDPRTHQHTDQYVGEITIGSVRAIRYSETRSEVSLTAEIPVLPSNVKTVLNPNGPIKHVIYVIKENRSYDQMLGDLAQGDGDPSLVWFGRDVTPNQHALAERFGILDNAYANAQVSADGHNWADAAIANDYVERFWPPDYGDRRPLYDFQNGVGPDVPHNGYLWDAAKRAGVTYRDYGEDTDGPAHGQAPRTTDHPALQGHIDPRYVGWDLDYSDLDREAEWAREFAAFETNGKLPQLEIVYLPNDHTAGTRVGSPTPQAYVATNDVAVGRLVSSISHSRYWKSTAIFILEDDAQNGPDHVSAQRSTFYIASPYARGGVQHAHYSTASFIRTMELLLGLQPLSLYDTTALPIYDAFGTTADLRPYDLLDPKTDLHAINSKLAYGAAASGRMDWRDPDAVDADTLNDILAHSVGKR
jgi:YVTN family beta-propeller protein